MNVPSLFHSVAVASLLAVSCTNSSHLLVYQHSNLGLNTGINPANQSVHARIGIRNEVAAIVPKYAIQENGKQEQYEAASAYFGTRFRINSIWQVPEAAEVLTTGNAAVLAASQGRLALQKGHDDGSQGKATGDSSESKPAAKPLPTGTTASTTSGESTQTLVH